MKKTVHARHAAVRMGATALVLAMLLGLTACGKSESDSQPAKTNNSEAESGNDKTADAAAEPEETVFADGKLYTDEYDPDALFRFGMVPAKSDNGKHGYINMNGDWVIEPQYEDTYPFFHNGLAMVAVRKRVYKLINRDGEFVSDIEICQESLPEDFSSTGVRKVDIKGEDGIYRAVISWENDQLTVTPWESEETTLGDFTDSGHALVISKTGNSFGSDFGIVDSSLNYTMEYQSRFKVDSQIFGPEDHLVVYDTETMERCVIDMQGNVLYHLEGVRETPYFSEDCLANVNGIGIIDETGNVILAEEEFFTPTGKNSVPDVEATFRDSDWIAFAFGRNHNYGYPERMEYWNKQGEHVMTCIRGRAMKNGLAAVCLEVAAGSAKEGELFLDETGSTCLSGTEDGKAWVVMNDNLEIQYFLEEKGFDKLDTAYYSDGYAVAVVEDRKADTEYDYIVDSQGNRLFERDKNPELPVKSILTHDSQLTDHW